MSQYLTTKIVKVNVDWAFEQSDHAPVLVEIKVNEEIVMGPVLSRVNATILEEPANLSRAKIKLTMMLGQILPEWDAHKRLELMKVAVRSVISGLVGKSRKESKNEINLLPFLSLSLSLSRSPSSSNTSNIHQQAPMLCILTSFQVLASPESWSNNFLAVFNLFCC